MFKFVVTIEFEDGSVKKKELFSLDSATEYVKGATQADASPVDAAGKRVAVREIVIRTKPWI